MRARIQKNIGVPAVVLLAAATIALYSVWGASVLRYERTSQAGTPVATVR